MFQTGKKRRITIKDVAQSAGVSTQTVSRVMNKLPGVSKGTRQRVETIVEQLSYYPSQLARSLIRQHSYTLGIVTFELRHIGPSQTLNGITDQANRLGYMLLLKELDSFNINKIDEVIDSLLARQVDGIIWVVPEIGDNHAWLKSRMNKLSVPILFLAMRPRDGVSSIGTDNFHGAQMAVQHLVDCKQKKIGHISGPANWWEAEERKRGWREALMVAGLDMSELQCVAGDWTSASGEYAFAKLLASFPEMDAVFVANDQMALSVLQAALCRGIRIPEQLAVVGFDNIPESAYFYPSLTTIHQDLQVLGEHAVKSIVCMIQSRRKNQFVVAQSRFIKPTLVVRESSKCISS
ncbi:MAG: LacI family DNA-binding transcriptional regulator [Anaerolineales bacterium]